MLEEKTISCRDEALSRNVTNGNEESGAKPGLEVNAIERQLSALQTMLDPTRHYYALGWSRQIAVLMAGPAMNVFLGFGLMFAVVAYEAKNPTLIESHVMARKTSPTNPELIKKEDQLRIWSRRVGTSRMIVRESIRKVWRTRQDRTVRLKVDQAMLTALDDSSSDLLIVPPIALCPNSVKALGLFSPGTLDACVPYLDLEVNALGIFLAGLWLLGGTSVVVGILNLLPIPPLDGGRVVFSLLKGAGRPVPDRVAGWISLFGFVAIVVFHVWQLVAILKRAMS